MSKEFQWYWSRLKCMSVSEVGYRIRKSVYMHLQKLGYFTAAFTASPNTNLNSNNFLHFSEELAPDLYIEAAEKVMEGHFPVFALADGNFGRIPNWNQDPHSGIKAPLTFGKTLNYRDADLVGDIKYLWEPSRHLQLVVIAQAYKFTGEQKYLESLKKQLESWLEQCPYLMGPNWTSSLELGIRLINWSLIWQLIGGNDSTLFGDEEGRQFKRRWLTSIYQHCHFIKGHLSGFSSANNHLIGEVAGLFVGANTWPYWDQSSDWRRIAQDILEREALLQNASDGVNLEQAVSYQQFVLDFLIISALSGKSNGIEFSDAYWKRIEAMMEFLASLMDVGGNVPMIGDADDGYVVRLAQEKNWCPYRSLLATGAILFNRRDFYLKSGGIDDKTVWLLGAASKSKFFKPTDSIATEIIKQSFPIGGYYVMGCEFGTEKEIKMIVDCGPLGYQGIAAHGHADALALTLSIGGQEFIVDPGTYAYHTQKKWRNYFRGTSAHNTIRIDLIDQSEIGGNFMWLRKAVSKCEDWQTSNDQDYFVGSHDGYMRLPDSVLHRREISLNKIERKIFITDALICKGNHSVECYWHFAEDCDVKLIDNNQIEALKAGKNMSLRVDGAGSNLLIVKGDDAQPLGWISRRYDVKTPTTAAVWRLEISGDTVIKTEIFCG